MQPNRLWIAVFAVATAAVTLPPSAAQEPPGRSASDGAWAAFETSELAAKRRRAGRAYLPFLDVPSLSAGLYHLPAGADDPQRPHARDEVYHVVAGRAKLSVDGEDVAVGPGSVVYVKAGVAHRFHAIEDDLTVLVVFASAGEPGGRPAAGAGGGDLAREVREVEAAFAKTMADRDHGAFSGFLSREAVFVSAATARGRDEVAAQWKRYFEAPGAPFSWRPETVEVLESGTLALSTGPVHDPAGKLISRFTSIWRQEAPGAWRIVFDKGSPVCGDEP